MEGFRGMPVLHMTPAYDISWLGLKTIENSQLCVIFVLFRRVFFACHFMDGSMAILVTVLKFVE